MKTKKKMTLKFYQNLGKLFYAVAATDNHVHKLEFNTLKALVKTQWLDIDVTNDAFDEDTAYQIEIVFDWLNKEEKLNIEFCFKDFVDYKKEQQHLFTLDIKKLIIKTANAISDSFFGKNKSELIMLAKLDLELKK